MQCLQCSRADFAGGLRCQWCGTHLSPALAMSNSRVPALMPASFAPDDARRDGAAPKKPWWKALTAPLAALFVFAGKFKALLVGAKMGGALQAGLTMLISIAAWALVMPLQFAAGLVALLLAHECGHALWMKRRGIAVTGMVFIPFLGAAVTMKHRPQEPLTDAEISIAGPIVGSLAALACFPLFLATGNFYWLLLVHVGVILNLFNLIPATPLDGGWITRAVLPKLAAFGSVAALAAGVFTGSIFLIVIGAFSALNAWQTSKIDDDPELERKTPIPPRARLRMTILYLGLAMILGAILTGTTRALDTHRQQMKNSANAPAAWRRF